MAIQSDPTLPGYNSYVSIAEADEYFSGFFFGDSATWAAQGDKKEALLITATRRLSSLAWNGVPYDPVQVHPFPRYFYDPSEYGYGPIDPDVPPEIPAWLKAATCEYAFWLWTDGDRPATDAEFAQLNSVKYGGALTYEFREVGKYGSLPPNVAAILNGLGSLYIDMGVGRKSYGIVL